MTTTDQTRANRLNKVRQVSQLMRLEGISYREAFERVNAEAISAVNIGEAQPSGVTFAVQIGHFKIEKA